MSLRLKMIYSMCTGAWGGYVAWLLLDPLLGVQSANNFLDAALNGAIIGIAIGVFMVSFEGLLDRNLAAWLRRAAGGFIAGLVGGVAGLLVGEAIYQWSGQMTWTRLAGWAIFGAAIGVSEGLAARSWRRVGLGALGGLLGGVIGSAAFSFVRSELDMPTFSRALGFTLLGAFIGLFVGLMPVVIGGFLGRLKVVSSGRNEGKEALLDKRVTLIGSSDKCDLCLYGKSDVQPRHAQVERAKAGYTLRSLGQATVWVNGQPATQHALHNGDRIKIGSEELVYRAAG